MELHNLKRKNSNKKSKLVGRGGKRGKTSGRGTKGQKARAGHKIRPEIRDIIKRLPKKRGYGKNRAKSVNSGLVKPLVINLSILETNFSNGESVNPRILVDKKLAKRYKGKIPKIKILGTGEIKKKISFSGFLFSSSAKEKIEKAGGSVT